MCAVENFPVLQHSLCLVLHLSISFLSGSLLLLSSSPEPPFTRDLLLMEMITSRSPVRSSPSLSEFIFVCVCVTLVPTGVWSSVWLHVRPAAVHLRSLCERQPVIPDPQLHSSRSAKYAARLSNTQLPCTEHDASVQII